MAELLDRYELSLSDVEIRAAVCERRVYETRNRKRIPIDDCIGAIADFCDCRVWREKDTAGEVRYVFFGLPADIEAAHTLTELVDAAVRTELGRYKTSAEYRQFRHQERHLANASFALGMVGSIADKLEAMRAQRDEVRKGTGRGVVVLKTAVVDTEFEKLDLSLRMVERRRRMIAPEAYDAGDVAGASFTLNPAIRKREN